MAYATTPRDFGNVPRNRYAAQRMGVSQVRTAPAATSDVHRLATRLVMAVVAVVALAAVGLALPAGAGAVENVTGMLSTLGPVN